ncbi:MAG: hypothetical protein J6A07_07470, partial [Firmicutes bacterium]|nr:hypothetical protein [Bacillota bacterium]
MAKKKPVKINLTEEEQKIVYNEMFNGKNSLSKRRAAIIYYASQGTDSVGDLSLLTGSNRNSIKRALNGFDEKGIDYLWSFEPREYTTMLDPFEDDIITDFKKELPENYMSAANSIKAKYGVSISRLPLKNWLDKRNIILPSRMTDVKYEVKMKRLDPIKNELLEELKTNMPETIDAAIQMISEKYGVEITRKSLKNWAKKHDILFPNQVKKLEHKEKMKAFDLVQDEILKTFKANNPQTVPQAVDIVKEKYGIDISVRSMTIWLNKNGIYPDFQNLIHDKKDVLKYLDSVKDELIAEFKNNTPRNLQDAVQMVKEKYGIIISIPSLNNWMKKHDV